jgi:glycosyltransferase involved in cell wall biosynthesis
MMSSSETSVRVWINVTTSANWERPAVGIIRVERALAEHLQRQLGIDRCRLCIWKNDRFVEWSATIALHSAEMQQALNILLPRSPSFDIARSFVARALQRFFSPSGDSRQEGESRFPLHIKDDELSHPLPGDILISVGLDWDQPYSRKLYSLAKRQGLRIVSCCYDLIPVLFPQYCVGDVARSFTEYFMALSWGSEAVLCISEHTRRDYLQLCVELGAPLRRTLVIPLGDTLPAGGTDIGAQVNAIVQSPFILFVSTIERRKNHDVLYRAYHLLSQRAPAAELPTLVFVGMPGWGVGDLMKDIELDPLVQGKIVQLHHVTDGELALLYQMTLFCVFPSLYEGWGLPVAEALSMGKAVIASGEASLPEVGGDLVRYVRPWDPYAWADAIDEYVKHPHFLRAAESRIKARYVPRKWADTAATVGALLEEMIGNTDQRDASLALLPGYDLETECGIHVGPSIVTNDAAGILLRGPRIPMRSGKYQMKISGSISARHQGAVLVEVISGQRRDVHFKGSMDLGIAADAVLIDCEFDLPRAVMDVEIRCLVASTCAIQLDSIRIDSIGHQAQGIRGEP